MENLFIDFKILTTASPDINYSRFLHYFITIIAIVDLTKGFLINSQLLYLQLCLFFPCLEKTSQSVWSVHRVNMAKTYMEGRNFEAHFVRLLMKYT